MGVCDDGLLELALFFGVRFSMNTTISTSNNMSMAWNRARLSAAILPEAHRRSNSPFSASNSSRSDCLLTVAMIDASPGSGRVLGLDRHHGRQHREAFLPR